MAAISLLDLLRKNPNFGLQTFSSRGLFHSKLLGASTFTAVTTPFAFGALFGNGGQRVAYCDAGGALGEDLISSIQSASENIFRSGALKYTTKQYDIQLKPLFSAFYWKNFVVISLRSFLLFYLPLLEPRMEPTDDDDDDDFLRENHEVKQVDLVVPFKKSVKQIVLETSVGTTRRVLERLAVKYVSQRTAWKLLKDVPKSTIRKAERGMPTITYFFRVSRTTFRGHFLGVLASWIFQVGIDIFRFLSSVTKNREDNDAFHTSEQVEILGKKVYTATVRCGASLIFASIGAGIGATLIRPSTGQWIGCAIGDFAGPAIVAFYFEKFHIDL